MRRWLLAVGAVLAGLPSAPSAFAAEAVTLRWESIPGAVSYELEIAADRDFATTVEKQTTSAIRFKWSAPAKRPYWWRVRGIDTDGRPGEFSAPGITGSAPRPPLLESPVEGARVPAKDGRVVLRWSAVDGAARYTVEVAQDAAFKTSLAASDVTVPEWTFERPRSGTWHWRVTATDLADRAGAASPPRSFRVKTSAVAVAPTPIPTSAPVLALPSSAIVAGGARLGVFHNLGEITSPLPAIELSVKRSRIRAALQAAHYSARTSPSSAGVTVRSSLVALPVTLLATYDVPVGAGAAYAGGGLSVTMFDGAVSAPGQSTQRSRSVAPGALLLLGYGVPVGRRLEISAEAAWSAGPRTDGLIEASSSGVAVSIGIRVPFSGGRRP